MDHDILYLTSLFLFGSADSPDVDPDTPKAVSLSRVAGDPVVGKATVSDLFMGEDGARIIAIAVHTHDRGRVVVPWHAVSGVEIVADPRPAQ